jgi:LPXTG-motif cell wall-anchored protein
MTDVGGSNLSSRRTFLLGAVKAGTAAGAAAWVAPQLTSVAFAQDAAGTPPPPTPAPTSGTVPGPPPGGPPATQGLPFKEAPRALPVTGTNAAALTIAGGVAVATGRALMLARKRTPEAPPAAPPPAEPPPAEPA